METDQSRSDRQYQTMYDHAISWHSDAEGAVSPIGGKSQEEFIAWMVGTIDGIGDNPRLSEEQKEFRIALLEARIETHFTADYKTWWKEWKEAEWRTVTTS